MISFIDILGDMRANRTRLLLTILSIAWGTVVITCMLGIGEGLRITFANAVSSVGKNVVTINPGHSTKNYRGIAANVSMKITPADVQAIRESIPGIHYLSPVYADNVNLIYGNHAYTTQIHAVAPSYQYIRDLKAKLGGRFFSAYDNQSHARVIFLGEKAAAALFPKINNPVGKHILIHDYSFVVIGVMKKKYELSRGGGIPDDYLGFIPEQTYRILVTPKTIDALLFTANNPADDSQIATAIRHFVANRHGFDPNDSGLLQVVSSAAIQNKTNHFFTGMEWFLGIIGGMTLLVAGVGVANVMYVSISHSVREIGIRMAIGAKSADILWQYIYESLFTTAIGGMIGLMISKGIIFALDYLPIHLHFFHYMGRPKPVLSLTVIVIVVLVLGLVGLCAGIFPARSAALIEPVEALRRE